MCHGISPTSLMARGALWSLSRATRDLYFRAQVVGAAPDAAWQARLVESNDADRLADCDIGRASVSCTIDGVAICTGDWNGTAGAAVCSTGVASVGDG